MNDDFSAVGTNVALELWMQKLVDDLTDPIQDGLRRIFVTAKTTAQTSQQPMTYLRVFQTFLREVDTWSSETLANEMTYLEKQLNMDCLPEMIATCCTAYVRVLASAKSSTIARKISITVPDVPTFLHRVYKQLAKAFLVTTYLFEDLPKSESLQQQRNLVEITRIVRECIRESVRATFPTKAIMKMLTDPEDQVEETVTYESVFPTPAAVAAPLAAPLAAPPATAFASPTAPPVTAPAPAPPALSAPMPTTASFPTPPETPIVPSYQLNLDDAW